MTDTLAKMNTRPHLDFTIEASTLGWKPGYFPSWLELNMTLGSSLVARTVLLRGHEDLTPGGELAGIHYQSESGNVNVLIIND